MAPRRAPDERGPFLGTEQIIRRLREARKPLWRFNLQRKAWVTVCASALVVAGIVVVDRATHRRLPQFGRSAQKAGAELQIDSHIDSERAPLDASYEHTPKAAKAAKRHVPLAKRHRLEPEAASTRQVREADSSADDSDTSAPEPAANAGMLSGWDLDEAPRAEEAAPRPRATPRPPVAAADDPTIQAAVRIEIRNGPGSIFVDGKRVALDRYWETSLLHGEHHLMVRIGGRSMSYKLRLRGEGVKVVFDDAKSRIKEEPWVPSTARP